MTKRTPLYGTLPPHKRDFYKNPDANNNKHYHGGGFSQDRDRGFDSKKDRRPMIGD